MHRLPAVLLTLSLWTAVGASAQLVPPAHDFNDRFGITLAMSGDTLVVGAPGEDSAAVGIDGDAFDDSAPNAGAAYVYFRSGSGWTLQAYLKASNTSAGDEFGSSVAIDGNTIAVGALYEDSASTGVDGDQHDESAPNAGAVYVFVRDGSTWTQQAYIKASNARADSIFGNVALSGDTLAVGANWESSAATGIDGDQDDTSAPLAGAAYVFTRNGTTWSQQAYIKPSNTDAGDNFGLVALDGDTLAVGALFEDSSATGIDGEGEDDGASDSGAVYVFRRSGDAWTQEAYIKASNTGAGDWFGPPALHGETLAVTAQSEDSSATLVGGNQDNDNRPDSGAAYVFVRDGVTWTQQAYVKASNTDAGDALNAASLRGDVLVLGAWQERSASGGVNGDQTSNALPGAGAAYVYTRQGETWTFLSYLKAPIPGIMSHFSGSAQSDETLAVSAFGNTLGKGVVYLFSLAALGIGGAGGSPGTLQFSADSYTVSEVGGSALITVQRNDGETGTVSVSYVTANGSATSGLDYASSSGTLTFPPGTKKATFLVPILDDGEFEGDETVQLSLSLPTGGATLGARATATLTITDDDSSQSSSVGTGDGETTVVKLKGPGTLSVVASGVDEFGDVSLSIALSGTTSKSVLTVKVLKGDGLVAIASLTGDGDLKALQAKGADVTGDGIDLDGQLGALTIRDLAEGASITAGGLPTQKTKILARIFFPGSALTLGSALASLKVAWVGEACAITAPSAGVLNIRGNKKPSIPGDFAGRVTLSGEGVSPGKDVLAKFVAKGAVTGATLDAHGDIGRITAGQILSSDIFAGFIPDDTETPLDGGAFDPAADIQSVTAKAKLDAFAASHVVASSLGKVALKSAQVVNEGVPFGILVDPAGKLGSVKVQTPKFAWDPAGAAEQSIGDLHVIH